MPATLRAILAAILIALVAFAGALFLGYHGGLVAAQTRFDAGTGRVAGTDMHFVGRISDSRLVGIAFSQLERVYYKPVDPRVLLKGERRGLDAYLKSKHVAATLPPAPAATDRQTALQGADTELAYAQSHYGTRLGKNASGDLTQAALNGMMDSLGDPYTVYLSPQQIAQLNEQLDGGNFGGIGVFIYQLKNGSVVLAPIDGLPAAHAGMHGDELVQTIDGQPIKGLSLDRIERMIRGPQGTNVSITTRPYSGGKSRRYTITRQIIHVPTVHQKMENGYNYIRLSDFGQTSASEVHRALLAGRAKGAKATILDLRDNGGGLLDAAVDISSFFIPSGVIVTEIDRDGNRTKRDATGNVVDPVLPMVVLVNGYTASSSEITSGALQDHKVATLIGMRTFGKGVVQGIYSMPNGGALKITTERYVTPSGRDIQHRGIQPDILVNQSPDAAIIDTPKDKQLTAAKAFLSRHVR